VRPLAFNDAVTAMERARRALAAGDLSTAERICQQVLSYAPEHGGVWTVLTETALQRNRPDAAIVCVNRAVALMPKDPIAHILRAKCLFFSGEIRDALDEAETAAGVVGSSPEALDALGAIFGMLGRHERAADLLRRAVSARPDVPQYLFNLAATERMNGMLEAAESHCDAAIALNRRYCLAHYLRSDLRIQTAERSHVSEMEALIREGNLAWPDEVMLRYALGKEYDDLEDHARSFDHVAAGADLQRRSIKYDARAEIAEINRIIATQTRAWLVSLPEGYRDAEPVFVVGLPRTGTTLVERIIAGHSAMTSVGEAGAFAVELRRATKTSPRPDFADLGRRYVDSAAAFGTVPSRRFVDKTLNNYFFCGMIHASLPRAKIICVRRDPLDSCWAMYRAHFQGFFSFSYDQVELAEYYLAFRRLAQHWRATLPPHAFLEVKYEDIVRDQQAASRRLIAFAGLPWEDSVLKFHESRAPSATASAVQIRRPVYSSSVGKWRSHADRLTPLRTRLASELQSAELE
jgi:tetratricopeptide (TPR) repeat protein